MKNRWQDELRRELKPVRVDDSLKMRILAEAERARFRRRRQRMAMAAVAAVLVAALGLTAALANLRPAVPDRRALSGGSGGWVWVCEDDSYYHARKSCGGMRGAQREELSRARAEGRTACPACITSPATQPPEEQFSRESELPKASEAPAVMIEERTALYTPIPDGAEAPGDWNATAEPTPMPILEPEKQVNGSALYTPIPDGAEAPGDWNATAEPTPMPTLEPEKQVNGSALYTPIPDGAEVPADWNATAEPTPMPTLEPEKRVNESAQYTPVPNGAEAPGDWTATETLAPAAAVGAAAIDDAASIVGAMDRSESGLGVWMTPNGKYYHLDSECSGMKNAELIALEIAEAEGRPACPVCVQGELVQLDIQAERAGDVLCVRVTAPDRLSVHENSKVAVQDKVSLEDCVPLAMDASTAETLTQGMMDGYVNAVETTVFTVQPADDSVAAVFTRYDGDYRTQTLLIDGASASDRVALSLTADRYLWTLEGGKLVRAHDSLPLEIVQQANYPGDAEYLIQLNSSDESVAQCHVGANEGGAQALNGLTELWFFCERYARVEGADSKLTDAALAEALGVDETWLVSADESDESGAQFLRIDETLTEEVMVYMTENGSYYHLDEYCSGMQNAFAIPLGDAQRSGKEPCPVCVGESSDSESMGEITATSN